MTGPTPPFPEDVAPGEKVLFLSAHRDDAVLSCGGLMAGLAGEHLLIVATVFTEARHVDHLLTRRIHGTVPATPGATS